MAVQQTFNGTLLSKTFTDTALQTSTDTLSTGAYPTVALFITVLGTASSSKIDVGVKAQYANDNDWYDLAMISTDYSNQVAKVTPFTLRFEGSTQIKVRVPIDTSGVQQIKVTGQSNDGAGSCLIKYAVLSDTTVGETL